MQLSWKPEMTKMYSMSLAIPPARRIVPWGLFFAQDFKKGSVAAGCPAWEEMIYSTS